MLKYTLFGTELASKFYHGDIFSMRNENFSILLKIKAKPRRFIMI